jgi:peptidoglycan hydrolase-like protein with peptidoglycan-binding domain
VPSSAPSPAAPAAPSYDVVAMQKQLSELGYYLGAADGKRGPALRSAVMAFQKVQGLGADGTIGPATLAALKAPKKPSLRASSPANRVEVDLTKQVLYVVKGGAISRILPVSSGNGASYTQKNGSKARSLTPTGWYKIQRRIVGERKADLGTLYDPQYFYRGWAIHGSNSVPAYPASHGCVRVTRADAKWLLGAIGNGMSVYLYGGTHTFTAGSSAPGTDAPTGDTAGQAPAATSAPAPKPTAKPAGKPTPAPEPTTAPSPAPAARPTGAASPSPSAAPVR